MTGTNTSEGNNYAAPPRSFLEAVRVCLRKYFDFNGRASRSEFWWFYLFTLLLALATEHVVHVLLGDARITEILSSTISVAILFPTLSAGARRLHDSNRSGWCQLFIYGPFIPFIPSLFMGIESTKLMLEKYWPMDEYSFWYAVWILYLFISIFAYIYLFAKRGIPNKNSYDSKCYFPSVH